VNMSKEYDSRTSMSSWQEGPIGQKRRCTDILFLLLIILSWILFAYIGTSVTGVVGSPHLKKGDLSRLTNGLDYKGVKTSLL